MSRHAAFEPAYLALLANGQLGARAEQAYAHMADCDLCARYCHVDRYQGIKGAVCRTGIRARVNSYGAHHGEEDPLRGTNSLLKFAQASARQGKNIRKSAVYK